MKALIPFLILAAGNAALAQPELPQKDHAQAAAEPERIVCRERVDPSSRLNRRRVCMTEARWAQYRRDLREWTDRAQLPWGAR